MFSEKYWGQANNERKKKINKDEVTVTFGVTHIYPLSLPKNTHTYVYCIFFNVKSLMRIMILESDYINFEYDSNVLYVTIYYYSL